MDIQIRFWNNSSNLACTSYLDSQYLHRPNADNLVKALSDSLVNLDTTCMIHLSMDGPNTNWKILKPIQNRRQANEQASLVNLQSCSLHVVSGALQTGVNSCNLNLDKVFTYKFLHVYCICRFVFSGSKHARILTYSVYQDVDTKFYYFQRCESFLWTHQQEEIYTFNSIPLPSFH